MAEPNKKIVTTAEQQQRDALNVKVMGRELRFRIKSRPAGNVLELVCAACAQEFNMRCVKENYFFTCPRCRTIGNMPGVLAAEVDRECSAPGQEEEKKQRLLVIREKFPHPQAVVARVPQARKG